jgi:hypothetical protein
MRQVLLVLTLSCCFLPTFGQNDDGFTNVVLVEERFNEPEGWPNVSKEGSSASSGLRQIQRLMSELQNSLGEIPSRIRRVAMYQVRMSSEDFSPQVMIYIQSMIETAFYNAKEVSIISPPELKTVKVVSTDTTFTISNTIPSIEELWELGDKLGVDAFLEGSCGKSRDGDIVLNLKLVQHRTGDIVWSKHFIMGPNRTKPDLHRSNWKLAAPMRFFPIAANKGASNLEGPLFVQLALELSVSEAFLKNKRLWFSLHGGGGYMFLRTDSNNQVPSSNLLTLQVGASALGIIFPKANVDEGHWLGTYFSTTYYIPFLFDGSQLALAHGYSMQLSRHFGIRAGMVFLPGPTLLRSTTGSQGTIFELDKIAYELDILNYSF